MAETQKKPDPIVEEARRWWDKCAESEDAQRKRMLLAKNFRAGDQWPDAIKTVRQGGQAISGMPAQPARPCLTIDRLSQPCRQVSNTIKSANFAIDVMPNGHGADTETAEIFKGYLRYVQNRSRGDSPVEWAADQAIEGGLGWFRIRTDYVYESPEGVDPEAIFDQEIKLERITNNMTVYCDPWATKPTRSDATRMFVTEDLSRDEFKRRWPKADFASLDAFATTGDNKGWVEKDNVRIAEYWRITYEDSKTASPDGKQTRTIRKPVVKMYLINAVEVLEKFDWVGSRIPLIPVFGEELNIDGKAHLRGIIEEGMDAQRMVNFTYSGAMEIFALGSKDAPMVPEGSIDDYKAIWQTRNTHNWSYWPFKPVIVGGTVLTPTWAASHEPPIQAAAMLMGVSEEAIKATTGIYSVSLGEQTPQAKSGRAIQALQGQSDLGSSNYPDNVRRALIYAGELMVEIIPKITRPGQMLQIMGMDDKPEQVIVGQPYTQEKNGQAKPIKDEELERVEKGLVKFYDVTKGRYAVTVAVGKSYTTKREEGAAALGELIPGLPEPMQAAIAPEFIEELSFPGAHRIAEVARRALPPELREPKDGEEPIPAHVQQQLMQAEQAINALTQKVEEQGQIIQTDQVKAQAKFQETLLSEQGEMARAQMEMESKERIEMRKLEVHLQVEMSKLGSAQSMARAEVEQDALHMHSEAQQAEADRLESRAQADLDRTAEQDARAEEQAFQANENAANRDAAAQTEASA